MGPYKTMTKLSVDTEGLIRPFLTEKVKNMLMEQNVLILHKRVLPTSGIAVPIISQAFLPIDRK